MAIRLYLITRLRKISFHFPPLHELGRFASWAWRAFVYFQSSVAGHGIWKETMCMCANRGFVLGLQGN